MQYWSPNLAGFTVRLQYTANEQGHRESGTTARSPAPTIGRVRIAYSGGNLYVAVCVREAQGRRDWCRHGRQLLRTRVSEEGIAIAASYKFGPAKISGQFGEYERDNGGEDESFMLGLEWAFGKHVLLASIQHAEVDSSSAECDMGSIGYRYDFSRRTFFIASYTKVDNDNGMNCNFGSNAARRRGHRTRRVSARRASPVLRRS